MEVMDTSLDKFYKMCVDLKKPIPETVIGKVAHSVSIFHFNVLYLSTFSPG